MYAMGGAELLIVVMVVLGGIMGERLWHGNFSQPLDGDISEPGRTTGVLLLVMLLLGALALMALAGGRVAL